MDKDFNRDINSTRAAIKNINQPLKTYVIFGDVYRGFVNDFHTKDSVGFKRLINIFNRRSRTINITIKIFIHLC